MAHVHTSHFSQSPSLDVGHYQPQTNTTLSAVVTAENAIKECTAFKKNLLVLIVWDLIFTAIYFSIFDNLT